MTFQRIYLVAQTTLAEAIRARFFNILLWLSLALLLCASFFQQFDFGTSELKFILDFGFGAVILFGSILTVVITTQMFFNEIEHRTAISILSRTIARWEFLLGKLLGVNALLLVFCLVTGILLSTVLWIKELALAGQAESINLIRQGEIFLFLGIQWLKFAVMSAMTLSVACLSQGSLYTMVVSFLAMIACQLQYIARQSYSEAEGLFGKAFAWFLKTFVPNLQMYNVGDQMVLASVEERLPSEILIGICLYSLMYFIVFFGLAFLFFRNREI